MKRMKVLHIACMAAFFALSVTVSSFAQKPTEIRFMWWGNDSRHKATLDAIKLFEQKYPNIKVKAEYAGWTGYNEKLTTQFMGKIAADLLQVNWNMLYMLGADNYYDIAKSGLDLSQYSKELIDLCTVDGKVVGIPLSTNGRLFYFNKATFDKAGIGIPQTVADMIAAAPVLHEKIGKDARVLLLGDYDGFLFTLMYCEQKFGKPFINPKTNKVNYTVAELKAGFDWYNDLVAKGVITSVAESQSGGVIPYDQDQRYITGKYAGLYEWSATAAKVKGAAASGDVVPVAVTPEFGAKPGSIYKITMTYAMYARTKHPKETGLLLNFLLTDPAAVKAQSLERGVPANKMAEKTLADAGMLSGFSYDAQIAADKSAGMGINCRFEDSELQKYYKEEIMQQLAKSGTQVAADKTIKKTNAYLKEAAAE